MCISRGLLYCTGESQAERRHTAPSPLRLSTRWIVCIVGVDSLLSVGLEIEVHRGEFGLQQRPARPE